MSRTIRIDKNSGRSGFFGIPLSATVRVAIGLLLIAGVVGTTMYASERANRINAANERLLSAANEGNVSAISAALAEGADLNTCDDQGLTPLIGAVRGDHVACAQLLLRRGASVNPCAHMFGSALSWAVCHGELELVRELLRAGADPNVDSGGLYNPLRQSAMYPRQDGAEIARALIAAGAKTEFDNAIGQTPAEVARSVGNTAVLEVLLANHAGKSSLRRTANQAK